MRVDPIDRHAVILGDEAADGGARGARVGRRRIDLDTVARRQQHELVGRRARAASARTARATSRVDEVDLFTQLDRRRSMAQADEDQRHGLWEFRI